MLRGNENRQQRQRLVRLLPSSRTKKKRNARKFSQASSSTPPFWIHTVLIKYFHNIFILTFIHHNVHFVVSTHQTQLLFSSSLQHDFEPFSHSILNVLPNRWIFFFILIQCKIHLAHIETLKGNPNIEEESLCKFNLKINRYKNLAWRGKQGWSIAKFNVVTF